MTTEVSPGGPYLPIRRRVGAGIDGSWAARYGSYLAEVSQQPSPRGLREKKEGKRRTQLTVGCASAPAFAQPGDAASSRLR